MVKTRSPFCKKQYMVKQANVSRKCKEAYKKRKTSRGEKVHVEKLLREKVLVEKTDQLEKVGMSAEQGLTAQEENMLAAMAREEEARRKGRE